LHKFRYAGQVPGKARWLNEAEMQAWLNFLGAGAVLDRRLDQQLKRDTGLSHAQYDVLAKLSAEPTGEMHMHDLADAVYISKSGLTYQVSQLERAGLVVRRPCEHYERGVHASITETGQRKLKESAPGHVALVRELFIDVLTPREQQVLSEALGKILRRAGSSG
jgi:DNA-binding MarR family transcriptional regulator